MGRKYTKREIEEVLEKLKDMVGEKISEQQEEIHTFIMSEVKPNAPALFAFMESINPAEDSHHRYGANPHPLQCGRCWKPTPIVMPIGKFNAIWTCPSCNAQSQNVDDEFMKCPHCETLMTQSKVFKPGDSVSFDYVCKVCRENVSDQTKIATTGGALVVCPVCSTSGTLPATDKQVIKFRKEHSLADDVEVRFLLKETQCPRCADSVVHRVFNQGEQNRIILHEDDVAAGFHRNPVVASVKKGVKKGAKKTKGSEKPVSVVGDFGPTEDEIPAPKKGVFFPHPGSKTFN